MVHQSSYRHIQAVVNNLQLSKKAACGVKLLESPAHNFSLLRCKEILGFGLTQMFL